jgi:uncharacterized protein (UPF0332 family)
MTDRVKEIFDDAYSLYQEAIAELERGNIRESAEKAWGATLRATKALILARIGRELDGALGLTKAFLELSGYDKEIEEKLEGRYFVRESALHGHCFYDGICEPREEIERRIRETNLYIEDAKRLALKE